MGARSNSVNKPQPKGLVEKRNKSPINGNKPRDVQSTQSTREQKKTDHADSSVNQQKIMITGDDILIEYVSRLMQLFTT